MARSNPVITSFNAGEWSPRMYGRADLAKYGNSCRRMENMTATVQGPATRRGGTRFAAYQGTNEARAWLASFRFSAAQAYLLEFGPGYIRFYINRAQLLLGGQAYEVATPYTAGDLTTVDGTFGLNLEQVGDVIYIAGGSRWPRKLTRLEPTLWELTEHRPRSGPLGDVNSNKAARLSVGSRTGTSVPVTATAAVFKPQHVGMLLRIDLEDITIPPWEPGKAPAAGALRRSDGKTYLAKNANSVIVTGSKLPVHEEGVVVDGSGMTVEDTPKPIGILWEFQDAGYGIGRIVSYGSPTQVTIDVQTDAPFPTDLITAASNVWRFGAWGDAGEYPQHVSRFKNRLVYASTRRLWLSVPGDFEDFTRDIMGEVRDDAGITREIDGTDALAWMQAAEVLVLGTESTELVAQKQTAADPLAPSNFDADTKSGFGSRFLRPERVGLGLVQIDKSGRRIRELRYSAETTQYDAEDLTVEREHITRGTVIDWAFQKQPERVLWVVLASGLLIGLTLERGQEVIAAHRHPTDGKVLAVEVLPSPDGTRDDVWLIVERQLDGQARRCVELMDKGREDGDPLAESFYVDCGLTYRGAPATVISGLDHLIGREVSILADGAATPRQVVAANGTVTLRAASSIVHVGLPMRALLEPMTLTPGSVPGKTERAPLSQMLLHETVGGKMGPDENHLRPIAGRSPFTPDGSASPLYSGWVELAIDGSSGRRASLVVVQDEPLPLTVLCLTPEVDKDARP